MKTMTCTTEDWVRCMPALALIQLIIGQVTLPVLISVVLLAVFRGTNNGKDTDRDHV